MLNQEECRKIVEGKHPGRGLTVVGVDSSKVLGAIEGFLGEYYRLRIEYVEGDRVEVDVFFVKAKPVNSDQTEWIKELRAYEKEFFLYDHIFKEFHKLGYDVNFAPKCYLCTNNLIVMEDLKEEGYRLFGRNNFFDMEHCRLALESLATYHGNSVAYEAVHSENTHFVIPDENPQVFTEVFFPPPGAFQTQTNKNFIDCTNQSLLKLCDLLNENPDFKESLKEKILKFDPSQVLWQDLPSLKTLSHGDLWSNNLLFKYIGDDVTHCCLVDFQILRYHYPCFDPLLLLYSNTRWSFRKENLEVLMNHYYECFHRVLRRNKCGRSLDFEDFWKTVKALESVALIQAVSGRTVTLLPVEITNAAVASGEVDLKQIIFEERPNLVVKAFQNDPYFRELLTEDLYNLNDLL